MIGWFGLCMVLYILFCWVVCEFCDYELCDKMIVENVLFFCLKDKDLFEEKNLILLRVVEN